MISNFVELFTLRCTFLIKKYKKKKKKNKKNLVADYQDPIACHILKMYLFK